MNCLLPCILSVSRVKSYKNAQISEGKSYLAPSSLCLGPSLDMDVRMAKEQTQISQRQKRTFLSSASPFVGTREGPVEIVIF